MSINSVWALHTVKVGAAGAIGGITQQNVDPALTLFTSGSSGGIDESFAAVMSADPTMRFTTLDVQAALALIDIAVGKKITGVADIVELYFKKRDESGEFVGGATDLVLTVNKGFMYCGPLQVNESGEASIEFMITPIWDGTTNPVVATIGTIPAKEEQTELFTMGPIKVDATILDAGINSMTIDPGIELTTKRGGDGIWPGFTSIRKRRPIIEATINDMEQFAGGTGLAGWDGERIIGASILAWARQLDSAGTTHLADASASHAKFTFPTNSMMQLTDGSGSSDDDATTTLRITSYGPTANLGFTADQAIV